MRFGKFLRLVKEEAYLVRTGYRYGHAPPSTDLPPPTQPPPKPEGDTYRFVNGGCTSGSCGGECGCSSPPPIPELSLNDYQFGALTFDQSSKHGVTYYALGVAGEAGEVAEKAKKLLRDDAGDLTEERREGIKQELGDVLWYVAMLAHHLELDLEDVASANLEKLASRKSRDKLNGDGDDR